MRFTINKKTNIRKAYKDNGDLVAVLGIAKDMAAQELILGLAGNQNKVIVIMAADYSDYQFDSIEEAKEFLRGFED